MMLEHGKAFARAAALGALLLAMPISADVRDGVEAWSRGDYAAAVGEWQGPADAGDADALFNLAQAYRLGRGVPPDPAQAEALYAQAAAAGHVQAADTYGLMLFQDGRREEAMPYVQAAARRGDPRARYLLGIAHFNGDLVPRDWERAYALLTLANGEGLPQASGAIAQMDQYIPLEQRQQGAALARQLESDAEAARTVELAQADLGMQVPDPAAGQGASAAVGAPPAAADVSPRVPRAIPTTAVSPSIAAARNAVEQAREATGLESPQVAGASYAGAAPAAPQVAAAETAPQTATQPAPPRQTAAAMTGPWRVQLGAFSVRGNAESLWQRLAGRAELAGSERLLVPAGRVTKLQAGGYASRADAQAACTALKRAGIDCLVTRD